MPALSRILTVSRCSFAAVCAATMALGVVSFAVGCGGNSTPAQDSAPVAPGTGVSRGRASFTIIWPAPTRLIPSGANSIVISLSGVGADAPLLGRQIIARPPGGQGTSVIAFESMEPGSVIATAAAFPTTDGTGVAQASGQVPLTIVADETAQTSLTMDSTIDRLEISPAAFRFYVAMQSPFTGNVTVTPKNAAGEIVLVPKANFQWTSSSPSNSAILPTAQGYTFTASGSAGIRTFTLRETESGKTAELPVDIHGPLYTVTDLGEQVEDGYPTAAYAINNVGMVVGFISFYNLAVPVIWQNGKAKFLGLPSGSDYAFANDINDAGIVVGTGGVAVNGGTIAPSRGFLWKPTLGGTGQFFPVPPPDGHNASPLYCINNRGKAGGGNFTPNDGLGTAFVFDFTIQNSSRVPVSSSVPFPGSPNAINDSGVIIGRTIDSQTAYRSQNGVTSLLPGLNQAYAINAAGVIAGSQQGVSTATAAILQNNKITLLLSVSTTTNSLAYGVNNHGVVVGGSSNNRVAFIWGPGINGNPNESTSEALNNLIAPDQGWSLSAARDINDRGEIVGIGRHNGRSTGFLLTPIP